MDLFFYCTLCSFFWSVNFSDQVIGHSLFTVRKIIVIIRTYEFWVLQQCSSASISTWALVPGTAVFCVVTKSMWQCPAVTNSHPCQLIILIRITQFTLLAAGLSAGWISGKKLLSGSAPSAGYSGCDISGSGWHCSGSPCFPCAVTVINFHSGCWDREREIQAWEIWDTYWLNLHWRTRNWEYVGEETPAWRASSKECFSLFQLSVHCWVYLENNLLTAIHTQNGE